jgi:hypothetical protein
MNLPRIAISLGAALVGVALLSEQRKASASAASSGAGTKKPFFPGGPEGASPAGAGGSGGGAAFGEMLKAEFPGPGEARNARIVQAVLDGQAIHEWTEIVSHANGHEGRIRVMRKALAIGVPGDALRVSTTFRTAQQIADLLGALMLTPKVSNLIAQQADSKPAPLTQSAWVSDGTMANTKRLVEYSNKVEAAVPGESPGLLANEGKQWVVTIRNWNDPDEAKRHNGANHGWYLQGGKVIQDRGCTHNMKHEDYSQLMVFMDPVMIVDGQPMNVNDVIQNPELAPLISDEGTLPRVRHPDL